MAALGEGLCAIYLAASIGFVCETTCVQCPMGAHQPNNGGKVLCGSFPDTIPRRLVHKKHMKMLLWCTAVQEGTTRYKKDIRKNRNALPIQFCVDVFLVPNTRNPKGHQKEMLYGILSLEKETRNQ